MKGATKTQKRTFASQTFSFHPYEENYPEVIEICAASGRKPAEELRDLLDEALRARRASTNGGDGAGASLPPRNPSGTEEMAELTELLRQALQKSGTQTDMIQRLARHLREQYGLLLETLAGAYGARQLVWKYVAEGALREEGLAPEEIKQRLAEELKAANAERDMAADMLEQAIGSLTPQV